MDLRRNILNCVARMAELAQDMAGHQLDLKVEDDGRAYHVRKGLSGKLLDALYEDRMRDLLANFSQTTMGAAVLSFLDEKGTAVSFDHRFHKDVLGSAGNNKTIRLRAGLPAGELIATLAHEARHHVQFQEMEESGQILPPRATLVRAVLMEADAHAFEQRFCEDYARVTGNTKPLEMHKGRRPDEMPKADLSDQQLILTWIDKIKNSSYVSTTFYRMGAIYADMRDGLVDTLPSHCNEETDIIASMADKIGTKFGLKREDVLARLDFGDKVESELKKADAAYRHIHDGMRARAVVAGPMPAPARPPAFMQ